MRNVMAVCLLVVAGWLVLMADMMLFFAILTHVRSMLIAILALAAVVFLVLGGLSVKRRRRQVLGMVFLLSALVMWVTVAGFALIQSNERWSAYIPADFAESFGNLTLAFGWLIVQTLLGVGLMLSYRMSPR